MAVQTRIKLRRATAAVWGNVNPVLALGEPGFETDTNKLKIGNGTDAWDTLSYASGGASVEVGTTAPVDAEPNTLWWNSETGSLYILYGTTWVDAAPGVAGPTGATGPAGPAGPQGEPGTPADVSALIPNSIIDAAGDLIVGSAADTPARLALGTNGQVLTSNGTTATWATPAGGGGMTLLSTTTLSGASTTISSIPQTYKALVAYCVVSVGSTVALHIKPNNALPKWSFLTNTGTWASYQDEFSSDWVNNSNPFMFTMQVDDYTGSTLKALQIYGSNTSGYPLNATGRTTDTAAITSLVFTTKYANTISGTVRLYGVN